MGFLNIHIIYSGGGLSSACQFQYNPRRLTRDELLIKHTYTILITRRDDALRHLGPGEQAQIHHL